jgi:hypothetical protein
MKAMFVASILAVALSLVLVRTGVALEHNYLSATPEQSALVMQHTDWRVSGH